MLFCSIRKGKFPRLCPAIITEGAGCPGPNWPAGSSGRPNTGGRFHRLRPRWTAAVMKSQRQGWGRGSPLPQGLGPSSRWPWWGRWSPAGHRPQSVPWDPSPEAGWGGGSCGEGQDLPLTSFSAWQLPLLWELAEWVTNGVSLTVAHLGKGPTMAPTNGWAGAAHCELLAWGRSPLQCWPMAEQDH